MATGANSKAAKVFIDHIGAYGDDPRGPEAYLKLGIAFDRLDKPTEACKVLRAGKKKFKKLNKNMARQYREVQASASCS